MTIVFEKYNLFVIDIMQIYNTATEVPVAFFENEWGIRRKNEFMLTSFGNMIQ